MPAVRTVENNCRLAIRSLRTPHRLSAPMIVFIALVPFYYIIGRATAGRMVYRPAIALDGTIPLVPAWAFLYIPLYFSLIALPILIVRDEVLARRMFLMYASVWAIAYIFFLLYPTAAPRPVHVSGSGFVIWSLQLLYSADPPYNCFPSLHVAHSVASALMCRRVNRRVGAFALVCAGIVALSTLFTKQHYILDVIAGAFLGGVAYVLFLRGATRRVVSESDRRVAPVFAVAVLTIIALGIASLWVVYRVWYS